MPVALPGAARIVEHAEVLARRAAGDGQDVGAARTGRRAASASGVKRASDPARDDATALDAEQLAQLVAREPLTVIDEPRAPGDPRQHERAASARRGPSTTPARAAARRHG